MKKIGKPVILLSCIFFLSSAALYSGDLFAQELRQKLVIDRMIRSYLVHVPPSYNGKAPVPLVIVLHGGGGNAEQAKQCTLFSEKSDKEGFIVVYPNGTGVLKNRFLTWNAGNCCGYALDNNVNDVQFIRAMLKKLERQFNIDPLKIYATGISNGGKLAYRLACELSDEIAAIAPVAGSLDLPDCRPRHPVSVVIFHGTADENLLYEGGVPKKIYDNHPRVDSPVSYAVSFWVKHNGCSNIPQREEKGNILHEVYSEGRDASEVELYTIKGGTHSWPGGVKWAKDAPEPTKEISATDVMWDFFIRHPKKISPRIHGRRKHF